MLKIQIIILIFIRGVLLLMVEKLRLILGNLNFYTVEESSDSNVDITKNQRLLELNTILLKLMQLVRRLLNYLQH